MYPKNNISKLFVFLILNIEITPVVLLGNNVIPRDIISYLYNFFFNEKHTYISLIDFFLFHFRFVSFSYDSTERYHNVEVSYYRSVIIKEEARLN